ncbi:MAG TPA: hypothetical protein ENJ98_05280 [Thiolapillus brandeum]|uniref:2-succinylbenzoate--CoA ligase n=1 Tax=Thiolapillus brandeum TaxID=1076588 RepID=A0A7C5IZ09_9GAMM|nr:hypothetical protein [Thiolapillus brandeum]
MIRDLEWKDSGVGLAEQLERLEAHLLAQGLVPGTVVAAADPDSLLKLLLLLLLPRLGCPFLPLDPALPAAHRDRLLELANASFLVGGDSGKRVRLRPLAGRASGPSPVPYDPSDPGFAPSRRVQLLISTSGSQGSPRLVALTGGNLRAAAAAANRLLAFGAGDRWLLCLPLHHVAGVSVVLRAWLAGAGVVLQAPFSPGALLRRLERRDVTHLSLVPTQLHRLLQHEPGFRPPPELRVVLLGGAPADPALVQRALALGWPLCPSYGLTEAASQVATLFPPPARWSAGLAGRPLPHLEVALAGDGRIRIRGESVAPWVLEAEAAHALADGAGWFTTGDLGTLDGEGRLTVLGRADEVIISGGEKIHPAVLEAELARCPGIDEVAVVGLEDETWGSRVVACYRGAWPEARVARWAGERLRGAFRPRAFHRVARLPRNALGKLLRGELRRRLQASAR